MSILKFIFFVVAPLLVAYYVFFCMDGHSNQIPTMTDGWWGEGPAPKTAEKEHKPPVPFRITTSNDTLDDLRYRLERTRFGKTMDGVKFQYGVNSNFMRQVVSYWKSEFNWEKQQAKLNEFPQFITKIEGIDVHFVRIIPKTTNGEKAKRVILVLHGWPETPWLFYKVFPLLTESKKGVKDEEAFEVVCPSIPGFSFSEASHRPGFDALDAARVFFKLMKLLGHDRFYVHGGDWGGITATFMAQAYPDNLIGVHLSFAMTPLKSKSVTLRQFIGQYWPSLVYSPQEMALSKRPSWEVYCEKMLIDNGYLHVQATNPDTIAAGLLDSPAGLAAYIFQIYASFTHETNRNCPDGCLTKYFTMDELLTNVMIFWLRGNIDSAMRYYKEYLSSSEIAPWDNLPVLVPTGIAAFPGEVLLHVRSFIEVKYRNVVQYTDYPRGGHFAALEEPQLIADDIKSFVKSVKAL